ncbi:hypothetical protein ILUMI_22341 [Ignelater luminosus]|uniref:HTH psq-type domain-containing protein n=1 Tax=Ignelater luminosus TaxID=2038154 RepID=A0A8K0CAU6_IGNLU|nr:hypothetical protein ILUMI_22341 [Ignelater luminosus]
MEEEEIRLLEDGIFNDRDAADSGGIRLECLSVTAGDVTLVGGNSTPDRMERAVREILINKVSIRETSRIYNISKSALQRAVEKAKQLPNAEEFKH